MLTYGIVWYLIINYEKNVAKQVCVVFLVENTFYDQIKSLNRTVKIKKSHLSVKIIYF